LLEKQKKRGESLRRDPTEEFLGREDENVAAKKIEEGSGESLHIKEKGE